MKFASGVCRRLSAVAVLSVLLAVASFGQGNVSRILGTVTDTTGGAVAGATVTVTDVQRGISRTLTTDQSGEYVATSLLPGTYSVRAESKGFKTVEHANLLLQVGNDLKVDLVLQPGEQTQTVVVSEEAPMVDTTSATLGGTLSNQTINDLPLMGRSYQNLLQLRPGMMIYPGGGGWTMSTNGSRPEENTFILEGLTNDNPLQGLTIINGPGVAGDAATIMPIDAIQELNIQENPPAEFGGKGGAVVNVGIKSGTNSFHGTAYAFGRDSAWDARNYFNPIGQTQRSVSLQQFGGTVGGRIIKDKLFFFAGYEGERYTVGNTFSANVPEALSQGGDPVNSLPDAIADLQANGVAPSALGLKLAGCTLGTPSTCTGGLYPTNSGVSKNFLQGFPSMFGSDNGVLKIDYHINDQNTLSGYYFQSQGLITAEDVIYLQPQWLSYQVNQPRVLGLNWTWTPKDSRWVNVARFGYILMNRETTQVDSSVPPSTYGIYTGVTTTGSLPVIQVKGFTNLGGSPGWPYKFGPDTVYQGVDYVSYLRGNHAFKFGGEIRRNLADPSQFGAAKGHIFFQGSRAFQGTSAHWKTSGR